MYWGSQLRKTEHTPEHIRGELEHIERALAWLGDNAEICPVILEEDSSPALREIYRNDHSSMLDALLLAMRTGTTFVSDDLWMRGLAASLRCPRTSWTHAVLRFASEASIIDGRRYVDMISRLIGFGQSYIGISGQDFLEALRMAPPGVALGATFEQLIRPLGGNAAEIISHCAVTVDLLKMLWADDGLSDKHRAATSLVMRRLLRTRHADYGAIFRNIRRAAGSNGLLHDFLDYWARGHFFPIHEITGGEPPPPKRQPRAWRRRRS